MTKNEQPIDVARRNLAFAEARLTGNPKSQAQIEMAAFLDFMHPEMTADKKLELIRAAGG